ncbi:hypothetical protein M8J77_017020 [Diaphorina citri]|nr:hypothetical protein M8J77_017020 [Diaphorina citri]
MSFAFALIRLTSFDNILAISCRRASKAPQPFGKGGGKKKRRRKRMEKKNKKKEKEEEEEEKKKKKKKKKRKKKKKKKEEEKEALKTTPASIRELSFRNEIEKH